MFDLNQFTELYPVSKTLRFQLKPVGKTLEHIEKNGVLDTDARLAESYAKMKKTIDEFHKYFIDKALTIEPGENLTDINALLEKYYFLYTKSADAKREPGFRKDFDETKKSLRTEIVKRFKGQALFSDLNKKELIQKHLQKWIEENNPDLYYDNDFRNFTTYFTGYNENRMNMYSEEEKATAVSFRLINENLPKFIDNIIVFQKVKESPVAEQFCKICSDMEAYLNVSSLEELFSLSYYPMLLTQPQIDAYNTVIGGRRTDSEKQQGLNEYINLYNQTHPDKKLPQFKMLFKQILSDHVSASWLPEEFENASELLAAVASFYEEVQAEETIDSVCKALREVARYDTELIYVRNDTSISTISNAVFGNFAVIRDALNHYYETVVDRNYRERLSKAKTDSAASKIESEKESFIKKPAYLPVALLQRAVDCYITTIDKSAFPLVHAGYNASCIADYFKISSALKDVVSARYYAAEELLSVKKNEEYKLTQSDKDLLKAFLDSMMDLLHLAKPLYPSADSETLKDELFYGFFTPIYEKFAELSRLYDKVRNFVTKKPYSDKKIKINFSCSTLLDGWDVNKETQNLGVIFLREGSYYLGIINKAYNKVIEKAPVGDGQCFQKMQYKLLPGPNKMLPKVFFAKSNIDYYAPSDEVMRVYKAGSFKKGANFNVKDLHILIDFFKESIEKHPDWSKFNFVFSPTDTYNSIDEFYGEISRQGYKITFKDIPVDYIESLVNEGKLYLFEIYNKDFSKNSKGRPNLHTMYWRALFSEENLNNIVYKLSGEAEIFYRKKSIEDSNRIIHPAGQPIASKNPLLAGKTNTFDYELIKDRRYTVDRFFFHVPITMNYNVAGRLRTNELNERVCAYLKNNPDVKIIGIDRGERHLLYISMIDRNGNVVKDRNGKYIQYSLNTITGSYKDSVGKEVTFSTPYHELLDEKEKIRESARENWGTVENIKDLKQGYLSQVVHHISSLMVEYNAIVVLEDLNGGFKNSRKKVEKQVYQNFEKALIEKLNYLVLKIANADEAGGLYHALQLAEKFSSFREMRKQSGFLFYVPAWNTSKIDPVTGFVDLLKPRFTNIGAAKQFFEKFKSITYNCEKDWFEFDFDYSDFTEKAEGTRTNWTVCTFGAERYTFNRALNNNRGGYEKRNVTENLKQLFERNGIKYQNGNLIPDIINRQSAGFFASLIKNLQTTLSMRYSSSEDGRDFILSPVADKSGNFFNSEDAAKNGLALPQDADANGAYNIARKGIMVLEQIDKAESYKDWSAAIANRDWLAFVQNQ